MSKAFKHVGRHMLVALPDIHFPYHDPLALACVYKATMYLKPRRVLLLGDIVDGGGYGYHQPNSMRDVRRSRYYEDEVLPAQRFIDMMTSIPSVKEAGVTEGNHDAWVERWCSRQAGSIGQDVYDTLASANTLTKHADGTTRKNFLWVPYSESLGHIQITDKLWAVHGWSIAQYAVRVNQHQAPSVSIISGHTHREQVYTRRDVDTGNIYTSWSPGCLCGLQPPYVKNPSEWVQGFSVIWMGKTDGSFSYYNIHIRDGRCTLPDGKQIVASKKDAETLQKTLYGTN